MKDIRPLLIGMLAIGLAGTWAYHLYDKTQYGHIRNTVFIKDSATIADAVRDSLNTAFSDVQQTLDAKIDSGVAISDSMRTRLQSRVREINRLKNEIGRILSRQSVSRQDLAMARTKIKELQQRVAGLSQQNESLEQERKELQQMLGEITRNADSLQQNIIRLTLENASLAEMISHGTYFIASDIRFTAAAIKNKRDQQTSSAARADNLIVAFTIQNNINQYHDEEIFIVVTQPDKTVLQKAGWNSSTFQTKNGASQAYTRMMRFDYERGERKEIIETLDPEEFHKGVYVLNLWHRGMLIGQASATLN